MTDPSRPQPVISAGNVAGLISTTVVAVSGLVLVVRDGITADNLTSIGTAVNAVVVALVAVVAYLLPVLQAHRAAVQVTPLASPMAADGKPLVPVDSYGKHAAIAVTQGDVSVLDRIPVRATYDIDMAIPDAPPVPDPVRPQPFPRTDAEPSPYYSQLRANAPKEDDAPVTRYNLGRLPNDPSKPRVRLSATQAPVAAYNPPASVDWYSKVQPATWGMDGNDSVGDCTCAEVDHCVKALQVASGNTEVHSSDAEVLAVYSAVTGYTPSNPSTDQGAQMQDVRAYWRKHGVTLGGKRNTILLFAEVDHTDRLLVKWCVARFGELGLGFSFPASAMDQFNNHQPWSVVSGAKIEGGHAVAAVGYDDKYIYVVTWGRVQPMEWAFYDKYVEEAWTQLSDAFVSSVSGDDPLGETLHDLGQQFAAVTGQPNPIPVPVDPSPSPTPAPTPAPVPAPVPGPGPTPVPIPASWVTTARHVLTLKSESHAVMQLAREIIAAAGG